MSNDAQAVKFEARPCQACELIRKSLQLPYRVVAAIYAYIFARPWAQPFNNVILQLALRGQGYKNCCDPKSTGEAIFIELLASTAPTLCIDIGANKGEYSQTLLSRTKATVIAFEPLPKAFENLSKLKAAYPERFDALNVGVGAKEDTLQLHYGSEDSKLASFSAETSQIAYVGARNVNVMQVPVVTLDSYAEKHLYGRFDRLDLLKIDTEGFEYEVLQGAQKTIARLRPKFIQLEYNWHQLFRATSLKRLSELMPGYTAYQLLPYGSGLVKRDVNRPESNIFHYSNFVFVREGVSIRR
jgi:FkbM family methyltransferase